MRDYLLSFHCSLLIDNCLFVLDGTGTNFETAAYAVDIKDGGKDRKGEKYGNSNCKVQI